MSRTVRDPIVEAAEADPDGLAIEGRTFRWSHAQVESVSAAIAGKLMDEGVGEGARVATLLDDDAPAVAVLHAVRRLGAALVPLNRRAAPPETRLQVRDAGVTALIYDRANEPSARSAAIAASIRPISVESLLAEPHDAVSATAALRPDVDLDAPATIVFTSGTTGPAKGAILTYGNHLASVDAWAARLGPRPSDRWLACLPFFHVAGLAMIMRASRWRVPLVVQTRFEAADVAAALVRGVSHLSLVPVQLASLLDELGTTPVPPSLRAILLGGGPIPAELLERARTAALPIVTTYGMTETASGVAAGDLDSDGAAVPLPGVELRIAPGEKNEILVRGPMVFAGYEGDDVSTQAALRDGWLHTGDLGSIDERGRLRVEDRRTDQIISGGENVSPAEVEAVLLAHPDVAEAAVVASPDTTWGAVPEAAIVLRPEATVSDATLEEHCRERLAGYKVPAAFHRLASLPRNTSGKILRHELRESLFDDPPS